VAKIEGGILTEGGIDMEMIYLFRSKSTGYFVRNIMDPRGGEAYDCGFTEEDAIAIVKHLVRYYEFDKEDLEIIRVPVFAPYVAVLSLEDIQNAKAVRSKTCQKKSLKKTRIPPVKKPDMRDCPKDKKPRIRRRTS